MRREAPVGTAIETAAPCGSSPDHESEGVEEKAGDGIRTHDVQLGNPPEQIPNPLPDKAQDEAPKEDAD
jgi:hypothetical protein